uniref:C2H2-type domain-containing protein n=1 Tax=Neogobius melanostomus TaxID=47308 RepID=A0A8C6TXT4_9GOBI
MFTKSHVPRPHVNGTEVTFLLLLCSVKMCEFSPLCPAGVQTLKTVQGVGFLQQRPVEERKPGPFGDEKPGCSSDMVDLQQTSSAHGFPETSDMGDLAREWTKTAAERPESNPSLTRSGRAAPNASLISGYGTDCGIASSPIPFRDSVCGRGFDQEAHLRSHMQTNAAKPIRCLVCSKEFSQRALLKRHMQTHSEEKSFSCPECGLRLKQQHNMHRHISAVHRREKPHICLICQKAFAQKSDFIIHMRTHTGEKPFVCAFCTKGFRVRASLNKHIQKTHAGLESLRRNQCFHREKL